MAQSGILNMFARSPVRPLQRHMSVSHDCASKLLGLFDALIAGDWSSVEKIQRDIGKAEREADKLKLDFRLHLPKNLFLPVPRGDLLAVLAKQELIANTAEDIAGTLFGRKMQIPQSIQETFRAFLSRSVASTEQAKIAISELDELLETGFRGREISHIKQMIQTLNTIERDTDRLEVTVRQALFDIETTLPPIDAIFLYRVIEQVGELADAAQAVGSRLYMLTASNA